MIQRLSTFPPVRRVLWSVGRKLYSLARSDGPNDPKKNGEYDLVARVINSGIRGMYVDVGANLGDWTQTVLTTAEQNRIALDGIVVIEPNPSLAHALRSRFGSSRMVRIHEVALSNQTCRHSFYVEPTTGGTSSLWSEPNGEWTEISVDVTTFDSLFAKNDRFAMVKIDAEGGDLNILKGMKDSLERNSVACVQFEYNVRWRATRSFLRSAWDLAKDVRYDFGKVTPYGPVLFRSWNDELERFFEANYLLVSRSAAERLGVRWVDWTARNVF